MEKENKVTLENGLEVTGATLLTAEEAVKLSKETRAIREWWWLRSPGDARCSAAYVYSDGSVFYFGNYVYYDDGAVRPALDIQNLESSDLNIGDQFDFGDRKFEIISDTKALCKESIGECTFREDWLAEDANKYEASDVKKFVDEWYENILQFYLSGYNKAVEDFHNKILEFCQMTDCVMDEDKEKIKGIAEKIRENLKQN